VTARFQAGTVTATNYARMRKGPSTEFQLIRNVNNGENVTIMGETDENWYYVKYKGEKGFISANLVYTSGKSSSSGQSTVVQAAPVYTPAPTAVPVQSWKTAYREYILANYHELMTYSLCYVDHDSIPELVIDTGAEAGGCQILTYHDGLMDVLQTRRRGFTYRERENLLCNSDGHMGYYYDDVYEIRNGKWRLIAYGEYDNPEGWDEEQQRYICNHYVFNGQTMTESAYLNALDTAYGRSGAKLASGFTDLPGIITLLRN
ncbi:MAG: SH3 domain-containing protein, partial [Clostridia bacterium]|nr:SH3 domain-containing protein [Clostridia bacterium]